MNHGLEVLIIPLFPILRYNFFSCLITFKKMHFSYNYIVAMETTICSKTMLLVITQAPDTLVNYTKQRGVGNHEMTEE
jgi:hypothetical protein